MSKFIILGLDGACPDIIKTEIAERRLPNFKRLQELGCSADNVPFPSAVTPGNWTSIATGSKPWTHGVSAYSMRDVGDALDARYDTFSKLKNNRAEFVWDAYAERGYRAATIHFPGALPQTKERHVAIGGYGIPDENPEPRTVARSRALVAGDLDPTGPYDWREHETVSLTPANVSLPAFSGFHACWMLPFSVAGTNPGYSGRHEFRLYLGTENGKPAGVVVDGEEQYKIRVREWTPFLEKPFTRDVGLLQRWQTSELGADQISGEFRMRIVELDVEQGRLLFYVSCVYPRIHFSTQPDMTQRLRDQFGPYIDDLPISRLVMSWLDDDAFYDIFRLQGVWQAKAAATLVNDFGFKAVLTKWHAFDKFYHFFMQKIDPLGLGFEPSQYPRYESLHRMILSVADEMVGIVLDELRDDTTLVVMSDHGLMASRRAAWVNRLLVKNGYIHYEYDADGSVAVDWQRTRAYVSNTVLLNVNLRGREPDGIVEPGAEYMELKEELIELLREWKDPATGLHVMSDVFDPRASGAFYGLVTERDGDIRYFTRPGYTLYRSSRVDGAATLTDAKGPYLGDHGSCRPTTRFGRGGEVGMFYAVGRGIRANYDRPHPIFPCDVIPTLLHIAEQSPLKQQEGSVLRDCLNASFRERA